MSQLSEAVSSLRGSLGSLAGSGAAKTASQWTEDTATLSSAVATFAESQEASVAAAEKTVSRYVSQEITVDVPTGILYPHNSTHISKGLFISQFCAIECAMEQAIYESFPQEILPQVFLLPHCMIDVMCCCR